jgi:hypothetical protein
MRSTGIVDDHLKPAGFRAGLFHNDTRCASV